VTKLRGSDFISGWHDFRIGRGGLQVFPRLGSSPRKEPQALETAPTGVPEFDAMLSGGIERGTSLLVMGAAGSGKSTLSMRTALEAVRRGERVAMYTFDETLCSFVARNEALGIPVKQAIADGLLVVTQVDPAEVTAGEFTYRVQEDVETRQARMVVIDSLNGYITAMPGETFLVLHLHELLVYLSDQRVVTLMTLAQHGMIGDTMTPLDVSYVADAVVYLRYFEANGAVRQALSVMKKRTSNHERSIRQFQVVPGGFRLGPPLKHFRGVLGSAPAFEGASLEMLDDAG
jgi:circadian clock protein KaiC